MTYLFTSADEPGWLSRLFGKRWTRILFLLLALPTLAAGVLGLYLWHRFSGDTAVEYADIGEHFKYGFPGGGRGTRVPHWIFQGLPPGCFEQLARQGYASPGLIYEKSKDMPPRLAEAQYP